jgi:hypothetical protein
MNACSKAIGDSTRVDEKDPAGTRAILLRREESGFSLKLWAHRPELERS